jgi:predicted HicB family RNase H-like nuclease
MTQIRKTKRFTVKWPVAFWKKVRHAATEREISANRLIIEALCRFLEVPVPAEIGKADDEPAESA